MPRQYRLQRRAEQQAETRRRIIEATVALHEEEGPARASISAIAARAGVERPTVYRHFPDERSLFAACTGHYNALNPPPDLEPWRRVSDSKAQLRLALAELYAYYRRTEPMQERSARDLPELPVMAEVLAPLFAYVDEMQCLLASSWAPEPSPLVMAAVGHAIAFETWRSLVRQQGLTEENAIELMVRLVESSASYP